MVPLATDIITSELTGRPSPVPELKERKIPYYGVKEAVFPFNMFPEVDPILGPEMRSTGEVLGMSKSAGGAYFKAQEATKSEIPLEGTVLISLNKTERPEGPEVARILHENGFKILATGNTYETIVAAGIPAEKVKKLYEGRPNILDALTNGEIDLIINTPNDKKDAVSDSYIRQNAIKHHVPYITTMAAARATAAGISAEKKGEGVPVMSLQEYHAMIRE